MARTLQQQLDDCDAAIAAIETGAQGYGTSLRRVDRAQYAALCARRDQLQAAINSASNGGFTLALRERPT